MKNRFAPGKNYPFFLHEIQNTQMKRGESVNDFYDRLNILISGAEVALKDADADNWEQMLLPLKECALEVFIRGLPDELARSVEGRDPKTIEEAVRTETRMKKGIVPSGETQCVSFSQNDNYSRSPSSNYPNFSHFQPMRYSNY